jgi:hypothetical protein
MEKIIDIISLLTKKWLIVGALKQNYAYGGRPTNQLMY